MAKKEKEACNFSAEIKNLKINGPERLYMLYGKEDYLRDFFLNTIKEKCLPNGDDGFSYKRFNGPDLDINALSNSIDVMPFLSEKTLIEVRDAEVNKISDSERFIEVLKNIPDYCTVVFVQDSEYVPDGRTKQIKFIKEKGRYLKFQEQDQAALFNWIKRRFASYNKEIDYETAQRLVFICGEYMNRLIPEIEKIAAYSKNDRILHSDLEAVASRIPEADVFEMIDHISGRDFEKALHILAELLKNKDNAPIAILSTLAYQFRRLYGARLTIEQRKTRKEASEILNLKYDFLYDKTIAAAKKFSTAQLKQAIENCVEAEYRMKTAAGDEAELLKDIIIKLITGENNA